MRSEFFFEICPNCIQSHLIMENKKKYYYQVFVNDLVRSEESQFFSITSQRIKYRSLPISHLECNNYSRADYCVDSIFFLNLCII